MSYFDDASLVMIPSGYKDQKVYSVKPTDGSGDLTFSRASNATRVNSSGLVEKVRENLLLQSNSFDTIWTQNFVQPPTANAIANPLTGAVDAWKLVEDATDNFHYILQTPTFASGEVSFSFYAKSAERTTCSAFLSQSGNVGGSFNLSTGVATASGTGNTASMVSVGNGWWRCIVTNNGSAAVANQVRIGVADGALINYVGDGTSGIYIYAAQAEQGVATDYIATTTTAVSVGPVSGLPRLDYSGGASCPSLLLEPQRTNNITFSENQGPSGTNWYPSTTWTVTNNTVTSPSGYQDADTLTETATYGFHSGYFNAVIANAYTGTYTISAFAKYNGRLFVLSPKGSAERTYFNLQTGTIAQLGGGGVTAKIEDYGSGWYRCSVTCSFSGENVNFEHLLASAAGTLQYTGDGTSGVHIWGCMAEAGDYPSSYIGPTYSSAVTRVADACYLLSMSSGVASGATAGTLFIELEHKLNSTAGDSFVFGQTNGTFPAGRGYIYATSNGFADTFAGGGFAIPQSQTVKMIFRLNSLSNANIFQNGVKGTTLSGTAWAAINSIQFRGAYASMKVKQILFSKSALTDAQCIELTTL